MRWYLSLEVADVPAAQREAGQRTYRSILVDGEEFEFSGGFTDLHTRSYELILEGHGFGLDEARPAVETVAGIRASSVVQTGSDGHPMAETVLRR